MGADNQNKKAYSRAEVTVAARLYGRSGLGRIGGIPLRVRYNEADAIKSARPKGKKESIILKKFSINNPNYLYIW